MIFGTYDEFCDTNRYKRINTNDRLGSIFGNRIMGLLRTWTFFYIL